MDFHAFWCFILVHLPPTDFWALAGGAFSEVFGGALVVLWQGRRELNAKRDALLHLLESEHSKTADSLGKVSSDRGDLLKAWLRGVPQFLCDEIAEMRDEENRPLTKR
jgi:hypothetical protein